MATPAILLYAPDGTQFQRYAGSRGSGRRLGRTAAVAGDGPGFIGVGPDSLQRYPFGTQMLLQDGRKYRFCVAGGTALVARDLQQAAANEANHVGLTAIAVGTDALRRAPTFTLGGTAATADQYAGGYLQVSVTPDIGSVYLIDDHAAVASSGTMTALLAPGHRIRTDWTTATRVNLLKHPYDGVIVYPTTSTQVHVGVAVSALAAYATTGAGLAFGWLQTRGIASVRTNSTVVLGDGVYGAATTAGSVSATTTTFAVAYTRIVGFVARVGATTEDSAIFLTIDG